jgi:nucleoside phosphorylase
MRSVGVSQSLTTSEELEPLLGALVAAGYQPTRLTLGRLECHFFEELRLVFAVGGHGKTQLAVRTQHLIEQRADFQVVICAGAAGSLGGDLALGDVVVGLDDRTRLQASVRTPAPSVLSS